MSRLFPAEHLDALLEDHEIHADVDRSIETVRALGYEPRPDVLRRQAALQELSPERTELLLALIARRLDCQVAMP